MPTRPLALDQQTTTATESGTTVNYKKHTACISPKSLPRGIKTPNDAIPGRMHAAHFFPPWIQSTYYDLCVAQLNHRRNDFFSPTLLCRKCIPCFLVHPIKYVTDKTHVVCCRPSLCVVLLIRTYITCTRVQTMSICPNFTNSTLEAPGTQPLAMLLCDIFWGSNRNHYYLLFFLVMRPIATSISMYVRVPTEV